MPGSLSIRRFELAEGMPERWIVLSPKYLTLYQLADTDVLNREPYLSLRDREVYSPPDSFEAITRGLSDLSGGVY